MENFEGSLFINSNRVSSFDPAALSRVTLAVKFTPLTEGGMAQVWRSTIARVLKSDRTKSISYEEALVEAAKGRTANTRQVAAIIKTFLETHTTQESTVRAMNDRVALVVETVAST